MTQFFETIDLVFPDFSNALEVTEPRRIICNIERLLGLFRYLFSLNGILEITVLFTHLYIKANSGR